MAAVARASSDPTGARAVVPRLLLVLFFFSGASSLVFENLWQRMMTLEFGASATATTAILTSFFFGIALGSYFGGKLLARFKNAFSFYWRVELSIGLFGLAVPWILALVHQLYLPLSNSLSGSPVSGFAMRFVLAVLVTLPATLGMGATIPAMNRILVELRANVGTSVALAYGLNTTGAVLGCLATGLLLVPQLGVMATLILAASINGLIAASVILLARTKLANVGVAPIDESVKEDSSEQLRYPHLMTTAYFFSGAVALGLEVTWMRILAIYSTSSTLTFTLALSVYLSGFGLGSLVLFPLLAKRLSGRALFTISNIGAGLTALVVIPLIYWFPEWNQKLVQAPAQKDMLSLTRVAGVELLFAGVMMFVPTLFLGLGYPAICRALVSRLRKTGQTTGRLYFIGTLGSMCGVLLVGLYLIPVWGFVTTLLLLCGTILGLGALIESAEQRQTKAQAAGMTFVLLGSVFGMILFYYNEQPFTDIPYDVDATDARRTTHDSNWGVRLVRYAEGTTGTVTVTDYGPDAHATQRILAVDGKSVAGTNTAALTDAKMLAHIPLLLHPDPKNALTVGFGTGGTSYALTRYPIRAECVEIEREVINSAPLFESQNFSVLDHPRFHLVMDDARGHLLTTTERYDMIATDVTTLSYKHNSSLYTVEYFQLMKDRLTPEGVACAWIPAAAISEDDFKTLLRSFQEVYPHATMWFMNQTITGFAILIGTPEPLAIDLDRVQEAFAHPPVKRDLETIGIEHPEQLLDFLHFDEDGYRDFVGPGPLHTDNHPILEFSSPTPSLIVDQLRAKNLRGTMPYRIQPDSPVFASWPEPERRRASNRIRSAGLMTEAMIRFFEAELILDPQEAAERYFSARQASLAAMGPFRNEDSRMLLCAEFDLSWKQHLAEHPEFPHPMPVQLQDGFDEEVRLAFYPQVGRFRPTTSPVESESWASKLAELKTRDAFQGEIGMGASTGLKITPLRLSDVVGYFCPLSVLPGREVLITFDSRTQLTAPATAGLALIEFDIDYVTPEQVPDAIFQSHVVAIRPVVRSESGDWEKSSLNVTLHPRTRMVHLVLFLDQATNGDEVIFDNVSFEFVLGD